MAVFGVTAEIVLRAVSVAVAVARGAARPDRVRDKGPDLRGEPMALGGIAVGREHPQARQGQGESGADSGADGVVQAGGPIAATMFQ